MTFKTCSIRPIFCLLAAFAALATSAPAAAQGDATLGIDLEADEQYRRCLAELGAGRRLEAIACLDGVVERAPESTASLKARAALATVDSFGPLENSTLGEADRGWPFRPGHLELSLSAGLFGTYTGAAVGAFLGGQQVFPAAAFGAGGAIAVGLGGAYSLGALATAELLDLGAGDARLLASGTGWGMAIGLTLAPWIFALQGVKWPEGQFFPDIADNWETSVPPVMLFAALTGYSGLLLSVPLAFFTDLDPGQVSMINTGGAVAFALAVLSTPIFAGLGLAHPGWMGLGYFATTGVGLAGGFASSFLLDLDVWEVLVIDAATLAAVTLLGSGVAGAYYVTGQNLLVTGALTTGAAFGTLATLMTATAGMVFWKYQRGERGSRVGFLRMDEIFGPPQALLDMNGQMAPGINFVAGTFDITDR